MSKIDMKIFSKDSLIIVLAVAVIGSFIFSYYQGYFQIQMEYFLMIFLGLFGFFFFIFQKSQKRLDYKAAIKKGKDVLENLGIRPRLVRGFSVTDGRRFSKSGKVWDIRAKGSPQETAVLLDRKGGEVIGFDLKADDDNSPIQYLYRFQTPAISHYIPRATKRKRKVEEEVKPA